MASTCHLRLRKPALKFEVEDEEEPVSPCSRIFHEPNFNIYVISIIATKIPINVDTFRFKLPSSIAKNPRMSSLQVVDEKTKQMKWVPTKVQIDNHITVPEIDVSSFVSSEKFVEDYVFNLSKTRFDPTKPMWDLHFLNVQTAEAKGFVVLRIHHSLGDGASLMSLFLSCCRQVANPEAMPTIPTKKRREVNSLDKSFGHLRWVWNLFLSLWWTILLLRNSAVDMFMFVLTALFLSDTKTPLSSPPNVENLPRRFMWKTVSLNDMKLIKNAMNMTINDVALGVTQAGISQYLNRKYGNPEEDNLPKNIRMRATLLMNLRPVSGIQAMKDLLDKGNEDGWGNRTGNVLFPLTIQLRSDPLDYVRDAQALANRKKRSLEAFWCSTISKVIYKLFGIKAASALSYRMDNQVSFSFSNVVGPMEEVAFLNHPVAFIAPSSSNLSHGLMINFQSYNDKMTVVVGFEENTIADGDQLLNDIVYSLKLIKEAANDKLLASKIH